MPKELNKPEYKVSAGPSKWILKFILIFILVIISQVPGCVVVFADDAGQINYFEYENLIEFSKLTFMFPLKLVIDDTSGKHLLLLYFGNLIILTSIVILLMLAWKGIKDSRILKKVSQQPTTE